MPTSERTKVDKELRKLGFGGLDDPNLIPQIAFCIRDHAQFRSQLFSVVPEKRAMAYNQLRPHLRFTAKPLDVYEAEMKEMAEKQQLPTLGEGEIYPKPFKTVELAEVAERVEAAIADEYEKPKERSLTLTCAHCLKEESFHSWSRVIADMKATDAGWFSEADKSWCPEHKPTVQ